MTLYIQHIMTSTLHNLEHFGLIHVDMTSRDSGSIENPPNFSQTMLSHWLRIALLLNHTRKRAPSGLPIWWHALREDHICQRTLPERVGWSVPSLALAILLFCSVQWLGLLGDDKGNKTIVPQWVSSYFPWILVNINLFFYDKFSEKKQYVVL